MPDDMLDFLAGVKLLGSERSERMNVALIRHGSDKDLPEWGPAAIVAACHEYAARRREQTHSAECWRLPGHEGCARGLLKRWWPVIEAARDWHETRHAILGNRSVDSDEALAWAPLILARTRAALKEGSADG